MEELKEREEELKVKNNPMIQELQKVAETDSELKGRLEKVRDYAEVYVFAKKRQKGCDGLGEMTNLKDEVKGILDEVLEYCRKKNYIGDNISCDIDLIVDEVLKKGRLQ
jgi:SOS response regulatory protein OraA/RecX